MKTIIIYATKHGAVEHAANLLKTKLHGEVNLVNIMEEKAPSIEDYDTVIIGGSIYAGRIQRKLTKWIESCLPLLLTKKIGLFICGAEQRDKERQQELTNAFPAALTQHALDKQIFGYEFHFDDMNFIEKKIISNIMGQNESCSELSEEKIEYLAGIINRNE